ncbi:MAG TPA: methionine--tRNA ligase [Chloroflexota bacterium]
MLPRRYYVTTSIPYVNASPHIGFALEAVQADVLARYHRQLGDDTRFLTGTDDNSLKNVLAAEAQGVPVQQLVDQNADTFQALREPLALSFDDFMRTSIDPRHAAGAQRLWRACAAAGDVYKRQYGGLYCVGCEQFYGADELSDGRCPEHGTAPEWVEEENYFFRLQRYAAPLHQLINDGKLRIIPETRRNEVLRFIEGGLADFSISRSQRRARGWGIPVPGDPEHVMYVWWDALINYITALDYAERGERYQRYWLENQQRVHVIGKGILRFHAVYWPAMLLSAGEPPPTTIYVHEYLTVDGQKISKSRGTAIDPVGLVERFGTAALRYWLLREPSRTEDADFTLARMLARYDADLANGLGNLLQRTVSMLARYRTSVVPSAGAPLPGAVDMAEIARSLSERVATALDAFDFRAALSAIWELVGRANRFVEETAPWTLARRVTGDDTEAALQLDSVLYALAECLRLIAYHLVPFLPGTSEGICRQLGLAAVGGPGWGGLLPGTAVPSPLPLFPRFNPSLL